MSNDIVDNIISIAKRRGFFYQSAEIYKPIAGFWDYGPLGVLLKKKIEEEWRRCFIKDEGFFEIEGSNIMPEKVFIASGHVKGFSDPI
ncbi:MAG: glycine--tRNA ligase, partial [Candidatus Aenigmatarchaeota archaeon]